MNDFVVTKTEYRGRSYLTAFLSEDGKINELQIEPEGQDSPVGNVYRGVVDSVSRNIGGAFIDVKMKTLCFLPLKRHSHVRASTPIIVQVTKDAAGSKEPVLTENIQLSGRYAVLRRYHEKTAFSRKLTDEQKQLLRKWTEDLDCPYGLLIRTNASRAEKAELLSEIASLTHEMDGILRRYPQAKCGECLWRPVPFYLDMYRGLYEVPDRCVSDIPSVASELSQLTGQCAGTDAEEESGIYRSPAGKALSLPALYGLTTELDRLTGRVVWLKSGGFLIIEKTEAFVTVDVNTGKYVRGRIPEETYRAVNLEAAAEIARQMRLRNLSGIILVDFIKLENEDHRQELVGVMRKLVKRDHVPVDVVDLTALGIMEIVRQKIRKPLAEVAGLC